MVTAGTSARSGRRSRASAPVHHQQRYSTPAAIAYTDRRIAGVLGVHHSTVDAVQGGGNPTPRTSRVGKDGNAWLNDGSATGDAVGTFATAEAAMAAVDLRHGPGG
jgi:hypothetical protein